MLDLATTLRKSIYSPKVWVKELWFYNYQDFRLIFEQSDVLHYFYVSANTQRLIARVFIVTMGLLLCLIMALTIHSGVTVWRYKTLEASKIEADKKRQEALSALVALAADQQDYKEGVSQDDLIHIVQGYRERLKKMQALMEFSSNELKQAYGVLESGLKASGMSGNDLRRIKVNASTSALAMGGPSNEIKLNDSTNQVLESYRSNLEQLERMKQVYKYFPTDAPIGRAITTSSYGVRTHPITHKLTLHEGLDYVPTVDSYAKSVMSGVVENVQYSNTGYGNMVTLLHPNKVRTIYAHLESVSVKRGQSVRPGVVLGKIGNTGFSTGTHLHYEISIDNIKVNPSIITAMAKNVQ